MGEGKAYVGGQPWVEAADLAEARERASWHEAMDRRMTASASERLKA